MNLKWVYFDEECFSKLILRVVPTYYFIKGYSSIFQELFSKPNSIISCKQHLHAMHIRFDSKT
jgi:hypothetical protein